LTLVMIFLLEFGQYDIFVVLQSLAADTKATQTSLPCS